MSWVFPLVAGSGMVLGFLIGLRREVGFQHFGKVIFREPVFSDREVSFLGFVSANILG